MTYRTLIAHMDIDGVILPASKRHTQDLDLAEELAEHWSNRILGQVHGQVGTLNYIAVQRHDETLDTWDTLTEFEW